ICCIFFFQAEDGIRDPLVTGVQTCALPIFTQNYKGKVEDNIAILNHAVATEIVCILRYKFHAACAAGLASEAVKEEFAQHAKEEEQHLDLLTERINQLGGKPNLNPEGVASRAASEYVEGNN